MSLYTIGDLHLSRLTPKPMDIFGERWLCHEEKIEENWRRTVKEADTVVIPGDISWAMTPEDAKPDFDFIESLPGRKLLFKGNHDYWWQTQAKLDAFINKYGYKTIFFMHNNAFETEDFIICGSRGWYTEERDTPIRGADSKKIVAREVLRLEMSIKAAKEIKEQAALRGEAKEILAFLHFPAVFKGYICEEIIAALYKGGISRCFYGHIHGNYDTPPKIICEDIEFYIVSSDYLMFSPFYVKKI